MRKYINRSNDRTQKLSNAGVVSNQRGIALPLTLILLFVMTLIAIVMLRVTTVEENMSASSRLRQIAFNAGESTLTEAERFVRSLNGERRRSLFFGNNDTPGSGEESIIRPDPNIKNKGDTCNDGYCTPAKYTSLASVQPQGERWEDPLLDVWNDDDRHIEYANFDNSNLKNEGVLNAPKYIIEFLGNYDYRGENLNLNSDPTVRPKYNGEFSGNCRDSSTNALTPPNDVWPYCASDPAVYRITVRATAGPTARQSVVFMQSILQVPY